MQREFRSEGKVKLQLNYLEEAETVENVTYN